MKRIISFILFLAAILFTFSSCNRKNQDNDKGNSENTKNLIWSEKIDTAIVCEDSTTDSEALRFHIFSLTGKAASVKSPSDPAVPHEIIFGDVGRELSDTAYTKLDREYDVMNLETLGQSAYLIYAKGGSLAIAYNDIFARAAAIRYLTKNATEKSFEADGVVAKAVKKTSEFVDDLRAEELESVFDMYSMYLSNEAVGALKNFYSLYGSEVYIWLANLYDPDIGGFYYSGSARNTEEFLPDLESTGQALALIDNNGLSALYGGKWENMLPENVKEKIGQFVISLQQSDGYFYHPQWGTAVSSSRRGRDVGWASTIIKALGLTPKYDTPSGSMKGENPIVPSSVSGLTDRLGSSHVSAVSAVVPTAAGELASEAAFKTYLDNANISQNSYSIFHNLNSRISEIKAAGLWDFLLDYLIEHQCENGLWEPEVTFQSVNGLMKVSSFFNSSKPFPRPEAAIRSAMSIIEAEPSDDIEAVVFVYNPWVAVENILPYCDMDTEREFRERLKNADCIEGTFKKLAVFKKTDGGFSYYPNTSAHISQGELVAVEGTVESDVNATGIALSTMRYMLNAIDLPSGDVYFEYDSLFFHDTLLGLGTLIKDPFIVEDPVLITFDNYNEAEGEDFGGVVKYPAETAQNNIGSDDVDEYGNYKWFHSSIVENPAPDKFDNVLFSKDMVADKNGNGKFEDNMADREMAGTGSNTEFFITNYPIKGNCYIFDADIYFAGTNDFGTPIAQIFFAKRATSDSSATLNLYAYKEGEKTYIRIAENSAGADGIKDNKVVAGIPAYEWFNLRIELYKEYDEANGKLNIIMKIFVNGEYAGSSDSGAYSTKNGEYSDRTISSVKFAYYRWAESAFYFNDVYVAKADIPYVDGFIPGDGDTEISENNPIYGFEDGIPHTDDFYTQLIYKNETTGTPTQVGGNEWTEELDKKFGIGTKTAGVRYYKSYDPKNLFNRVMKVYAWNTDSVNYNGNLYVDEARMSETASVYEATFDYYFEQIPWLFEDEVFSLDFLSKTGTRLTGITFAAKEIPESNKDQSEIVIKRDNGTVVDGISFKCDTWYSLKFEYYYDNDNFRNSKLKIYVLDENSSYVCIFDEILFTKAGVICGLGMTFMPYKMRSVQYFDNLSFALIDKEYSVSQISALDSVKITGLVSRADSDGTGEPLPDVNDNRGTGLYIGEAEKYGESAENYLPTKGFDDNVTLDVKPVDGDSALNFYHAKDAETRFQLKASDFKNSFVFETDIKFDFLPDESSRGIQIFGAKTVGSNGNVWSGATVNLEYDDTLKSYVLKGAGGKCAVTVGKWMNIRLEADGLTEGSKIRFYVNGKLYGISTLTGSISSIKALEVLTPAGNSSGASLMTVMSFDNTYIGEKLYESPSINPPTEGGSNISGDDMDGDSWDKN